MKRKLRLFWYNTMIRFCEDTYGKCFYYKRPYKRFYRWLADKCEIDALLYKIKWLSWYYNA